MREWTDCDKDSLEDMERALCGVLDLLAAPEEMRSARTCAGYEDVRAVAEAALVECQATLASMGPRGF